MTDRAWRRLPSVHVNGHQADCLIRADRVHITRRLRCQPGSGLVLMYQAKSPRGEPLGPWRRSRKEAEADIGPLRPMSERKNHDR